MYDEVGGAAKVEGGYQKTMDGDVDAKRCNRDGINVAPPPMTHQEEKMNEGGGAQSHK